MEARGEDEERALPFCDYELQRSPASYSQPIYVRDPAFRNVDLVENGAVSSDRGFFVEEIEMQERVSRGAHPAGASDRRGDLEASSSAVDDYIARSSSVRSGSKAVEMRRSDGGGGDSEVAEARAGSPEWNGLAFPMLDGAPHGSQQGTSRVPSRFEIRGVSATSDGEGWESEVAEATAGSPEWNSAAYPMLDGAPRGLQQGTSTIPSPFEIRGVSARSDGEGWDSEVAEATAGSPEWNSSAFPMHDRARHGSQQGTSTVPSPFETRGGSATRSTSVSEQNRADTAYQMAPPPNPLSAKSLKLTPALEYVSALAYLTTFGILGVLIRYGLEILFFNVTNTTGYNSILFIDLPANMVGCFFMGWVGVVLKKDIAVFSELLAIGLSTGLMGSITTYASWNQQMLAMITQGLWLQAILGVLLGMELSQMSLVVGMDSAKLLQSGIAYCKQKGCRKCSWSSTPDNLRRRKVSLILFLATGGTLWVGAVVLTVIDTRSISRRRLWLGCVVGPPGVWARWLLARLNGQGIGPKRVLRWLPVGTLLTNLVSSSLEAILAVVLIVVPHKDAALLVKGLQLGLLGCMSTVSTFVVEIYALHQSVKRWRAYAYTVMMISATFTMGALVYTLPVLT